MTKLSIENGVFYLLEAGKEKSLFDTEESAVGALKGVVSKNKDLNPESVAVFEVNTAQEKWQIQSIPWAKIAMGLIRG